MSARPAKRAKVEESKEKEERKIALAPLAEAPRLTARPNSLLTDDVRSHAMYRAQVGARVADGVREFGSLESYIGDFHACSKAFEMFVADRLSAVADARRFMTWEDLDAATKEARGLTKADSGVDVTDGTTTLVQCKLRARYLTWRECATFFASAVSYTNGAYSVGWTSLLLARNSCSRLSRTLAELASSRPFDAPIPLSEFRAYAAECLAAHNDGAMGNASQPFLETESPTLQGALELRDYQVDAVALCTKVTTSPAYVVLPTGCGKSLVMARVAACVQFRVLIFVPLVVLLDQLIEVLLANGCEATAVGGGRECTASEISAARVVVCVYNSAHKVDATKFDRVLVDEAHCAHEPAIYSDVRDETDTDDGNDATPEGSLSGYAAVRAASRLVSARLLSATLDVPDGAERCERTLRWTIDAGYLCDYTLDVPVFDVGAESSDLARHIVRTYRSIIIFCSTRAEGVSFCAAMNELGPCARYIDCETGRRERSVILAAFKSGELAFIVNVRVLAMGFDAPITKGVCFVNMPASKTHIVQVIGRCLRLHPDKQLAHIILPLSAGTDDEDKRVRDFMSVLARNDSRFAQALRANGGGYVSVRRVERGGVDEAGSDEDMSEEESESALELLFTAVYDSMGLAVSDRWSARFDELVAYHEEHGRFPPLCNTGTTPTPPLGRWVSTQRMHRATMNQQRKARLEALEWWTWGLAGWDERFDELCAYYAQHREMPPPSTPGLGIWVRYQRAIRNTICPARKARLDALEWWAWSLALRPRVGWDARFDELVTYYAEHLTLPPQCTPSGLGRWVGMQRRGRATMDAERKARLDALAWWSWDALHGRWTSRGS